MLIGFVLIYALTCLTLEWQGVIMFSEPLWLGLIGLGGWFWWIHSQGFHGLVGWRGHVALIMRLCLLGLLAMVLAEPRAVRESDSLAVVYVVDISDSIGSTSVDDALTYIMRSVGEKPADDMAGLVVFGRNSAVELPPRVIFPFEAINVRVASDGTNLSQALSLAAAVLPPENPGRIVLISDGVSTEGALPTVLDELHAQKIPVDVLPIDYQFENEVWLEKIELPQVTREQETYDVSVLLNALRPGSGRLVIRENNQVIAEQEVDYTAGKNRYEFKVEQRGAGYYEYEASIEPTLGGDGWLENNRVADFHVLDGGRKILLVVDAAGDRRDWQSLEDAIRASARPVDRRDATDFPRSAVELLPYDAIILANVSAENFDVVQMTAVRDAVYNLGIGLVMVGGENSFGPGGYHRSPIEEALPVSMDVSERKVLPSGALALVLDRSGSMHGHKLLLAKRASVATLNLLTANDFVTVIAFDSDAHIVVPMTPVDDRNAIAQKIHRIDLGGGTNIYPGMVAARKALEASPASVRHMVVLTDGDTYGSDYEKLAVACREAGITISTVGIGDGANMPLLQRIAQLGGGVFHMTQNPDDLVRILITEARTLKRSMIQTIPEGMTPTLEYPSAVLKGIDSLPKIYGYVLTTIKPRAELVLQNAGEESPDPVLATWRFGLGRSAALTSDLAPRWGRDWVNWDQYETFVKQLLIDVSRTTTRGKLKMQTFTSAGQGYIRIEDQHEDPGMLEIHALVSDPDGMTEQVRLLQVAPNRYEASFPVDAVGRYQILAQGSGGGRNEQAVGGFVVSYSPEYLRFQSNPIVLREIVERTGGRVLRGDETGRELFIEDRASRRSTLPVFDWFLIALVCLIPVDVAVRRIQIDWGLIFARLKPGSRAKTGPATATLGSLLATKQAVSDRLRSSSSAAEPAHLQPRADTGSPGDRSGAAKTTQPPAASPASNSEKAAADENSTTARLLARKRKRREEQDNDQH